MKSYPCRLIFWVLVFSLTVIYLQDSRDSILKPYSTSNDNYPHIETLTALSLDDLDLLLWFIVLLVQSLPYVTALLMSVISAFPTLPSTLIVRQQKAITS